MEAFPLYLAPESDEWEEIECDEVIQNITINIHVCPINNLAELIPLRLVFVNKIYFKLIKIKK
jgi:hypothetical protein